MVSLQSQIERSGSEVEDQKTGCVKRRVLKKRFKIYIKTFGQFKNSLYFCTRKSEQTTEKSFEEAKRREIIDIQITTKKVRKN